MTRKLTFKGHSDDLFTYDDTHSQGDEAHGNPAVFKLSQAENHMYVIGTYYEGCWSVGVCQYDEEPLPPWSMRLSSEGYSTLLTVHVPEDVTVEAV